MSARFGGADDAAAVLISRAQFDRMRAAATFVYDPGTGNRRRLTADEARDRSWMRTQHLIALSMFGQRLPGGVWEYDLIRRRRLERKLIPPSA